MNATINEIVNAPYHPVGFSRRTRRFTEFHLDSYLSDTFEMYKSRKTSSETLPWNSEYGGCSGRLFQENKTKNTIETNDTAIIFVHGNRGDCTEWKEYFEYFLENGFSPDELWAISFSEKTPERKTARKELDDFLTNVRKVTGAKKIQLVSHSMGVLVARDWIAQTEISPEIVQTHIAIGGPNHGVPQFKITPYPDEETEQKLSKIEPNSDFLQTLNQNKKEKMIQTYTIGAKHDLVYAPTPETVRIPFENEYYQLSDKNHFTIMDSQESRELISDILRQEQNKTN